MPGFGLIGYPLSHSFSKKYFDEKFEKSGLTDYSYSNFPIQEIKDLPTLLDTHPDLIGFNVTKPYKTAIIPFLDDLDADAREAQAVNTVLIRHDKKKRRLTGFNTDIEGFKCSLLSFIGSLKAKALLLGTGGASNAAGFVLRKLDIPYTLVSRQKNRSDALNYKDINPSIINDYHLIINTTPLGMYPNNGTFPNLPYHAIGQQHYLFDMVYNPSETEFLRKGREQGCSTRNGLQMLHLQANMSFLLWQKEILNP